LPTGASGSKEGENAAMDLDELKKKRVVYEMPGMDQVRLLENRIYKEGVDGGLLLDVYAPPELPAGEQRPAVLFVHGLGPAELIEGIKNSGQYVSWGQLTAASDLIAVTFNHRSPNAQLSFLDVAGDVDDLVRSVREHAEELSIDKDRLAIWGCSAGVPLSMRAALRGAPPFVKCVVAYYGPLDMHQLQADWELTEAEVQQLSATTYLEHAEELAPMFVAKAGLDHPLLNASIDQFIKEASAKNATLEYWTHPGGRHAFDVLDDVARSREIIQRTLEFLKTHLA
jgi:acetyl esterase/lipase